MPDMTSSVRRVRVAFNAPPKNIMSLENYITIYDIVTKVYQERLYDGQRSYERQKTTQ